MISRCPASMSLAMTRLSMLSLSICTLSEATVNEVPGSGVWYLQQWKQLSCSQSLGVAVALGSESKGGGVTTQRCILPSLQGTLSPHKLRFG